MNVVAKRMVTALFLAVCTPLAMSISCQGDTSSGPTQVYKAFLSKCYYAKDARECAPYMWKPWREAFDKMSLEQRIQMMKWFKSNYIARVRVDKEEVSGDEAELTGKGWTSTGATIKACDFKVNLVREDNGWKIKQHTYGGTIQGGAY